MRLATPAEAEVDPAHSAVKPAAITADASHALRMTDLHTYSIIIFIAHPDIGGDSISASNKVNIGTE
jgi:hypothetical protein